MNEALARPPPAEAKQLNAMTFTGIDDHTPEGDSSRLPETRKEKQDMNRSGTITYRNPDGEFRGQQRIQKEEQMPDPIGVAFFARFLLKYKDQFTEEREQGGEIFNRNCDLHGAGCH